MLTPLDGDPKTYQTWAEKYYERTVSPAAVRQIYGHHPLTVDLVSLLDPAASLEDVRTEAVEIGYPVE